MTRSLIFIDANIYLKLYKAIDGRALLTPLQQFADNIFITQQVVDEVQRNKLNVAERFLAGEAQKVFTPGISDHLFEDDPKAAQIREHADAATALRKELNKLFAKMLGKISRSDDDVSKKLKPLFARAMKATPEQLERARARRERGNPPGKLSNPLGDQISWEQILDNARGVRHFFLIAEDHDYFTEYKKRLYLNPLLYSDLLASATTSVMVHCSKSLLDGLKEFAEVTKAPAESIPTGEQAKEIEKEMAPPTFGYDGMSDEIAIRNRHLAHRRIVSLIANGVIG